MFGRNHILSVVVAASLSLAHGNAVATGTGSAQGTVLSSNNNQNDGISSTAGNQPGSQGSFILSVFLVTAGAGATAASVLVTRHYQGQKKAEEAQALLQRFLQERHALVSRDVLRGHGDVFDAWEEQLQLTAAERASLRAQLQTRPLRLRMLRALDAQPLERSSTVAFATAYFEALEHALSEERLAAIISSSPA